jgi:hypothetical protein
MNGDTPSQLSASACLVLHAIPLPSFGDRRLVNVTEMLNSRAVTMPVPHGSQGSGYGTALEGVLSIQSPRSRNPTDMACYFVMNQSRVSRQEARSRVEAICLRRERAFAAKLPNGAQIAERAGHSLIAYAGQSYWTDEAFRQRYEEDLFKTFEYIGVPQWLMPTLLVTWRLRQRRVSGCRPALHPGSLGQVRRRWWLRLPVGNEPIRPGPGLGR